MSSNGLLKYPYYSGNPERRREDGWRKLPASRLEKLNDPAGYIPDKGLVDAANVALTLGQPLLLTGEPGTGKTQFAASIAYELGFDQPLKFEVKSTTQGRDLFYTFDTVGRFHAAQSSASGADAVNYIHYNALGRAIVLANDPNTVGTLLPPDFTHPGCRRSVVLIDEVDKAPRDVPNDILNEIEAMYFRIPEVNNQSLQADPEWSPIVIVTSNSEKALPDAFLRRCIYYHLPFPDENQLSAIINARIGRRFTADNGLLLDVLSIFRMARDPRWDFEKPPSTAELLNWLVFLSDRARDTQTSLTDDQELMMSCRQTLFKKQEDLKRADEMMAEWITGKS